MINLGELKPIKLGRKTVFLESEVIAWVNSKADSRTGAKLKRAVR
jgi:predicted DNA-binding transcriptional regulator AlpA